MPESFAVTQAIIGLLLGCTTLYTIAWTYGVVHAWDKKLVLFMQDARPWCLLGSVLSLVLLSTSLQYHQSEVPSDPAFAAALCGVLLSENTVQTFAPAVIIWVNSKPDHQRLRAVLAIAYALATAGLSESVIWMLRSKYRTLATLLCIATYQLLMCRAIYLTYDQRSRLQQDWSQWLWTLFRSLLILAMVVLTSVLYHATSMLPEELLLVLNLLFSLLPGVPVCYKLCQIYASLKSRITNKRVVSEQVEMHKTTSWQPINSNCTSPSSHPNGVDLRKDTV